MRDTFSSGELTREADVMMELHGKNIVTALVYGVAGVAPRSTMQNLSEVLHCMASRRTGQARAFLNDILFSVRPYSRDNKVLTNLPALARLHYQVSHGHTEGEGAVHRFFDGVSVLFML